ncbi:MAG: bifunctional histidinol-phosphatase/imidazoleglycerol-phosphate dehydratase HisB [Bacteroidales bacterium]
MNKKVLFIDRDGTIIKEPTDFQIDSLNKFNFVPKVISNLRKVAELKEYLLVMVSNQDALGTDAFPYDAFEAPQSLMLDTLAGEGFVFDDILIDKSTPEENSLNRKPNTGMLTEYLNGSYDLANSYVIGDRITDIQLAQNIGCKAIFISNDDTKLKNSGLEQTCVLYTTDWDEIYSTIALSTRNVSLTRNTNETKINITLNIDGRGQSKISTGLIFFNHMLDQLARHSECDIELSCIGDLNVDEHHTIEDVAIVVGEAFQQAVGNKAGMERYGFFLPMDDCNAQVAIDFSGRPWINWDADFKREYIGDMPTEMIYHFFKSFSDSARCNLYVKAEGKNEHHKLEAIFKALAKSIKMAKKRNPDRMILPSTKGKL